MIGISFYLHDKDAKKRLLEASEYGVTRAFTSLHIPEEKGDLAERAKELLHVARNCGISVYADVSQHTPVHLGIESLMTLSLLGVSGIRLDDGFSVEETLSLANEFYIAVNASTLSKQEIEALLSAGLHHHQLLAWHNFYPRPDTGLEETFFQQQTDLFNELQIPVCAYIPGEGEKRGPIYQGLPTREKDRNRCPFTSAVDLYRCGVTEIYIGDLSANLNLLKRLVQYQENRIIPLRIRSPHIEGTYSVRPDLSRDVLRLVDTRSIKPVPPYHTVERRMGAITMDNDGYGRYRGEVQIAKTNLPANANVNVIGYVIEEDHELLSLVRPGQKLELVTV
ncbi:MupG family TIM beta-alpha barrel fold protein [Priestia megaterium]|uniref:MupG family TIM beta-alpha barrel fold protein n=1 Tax=Priestia megaterium TaxID=1404 RepID=UPI002A6A37AA|nr:MupG family TIM beta-alpha barrel fold protein [Priestia megaterium]MDY0939851.1 MupG family TIM beta-alpha barrel fold protein [Priestia megaterium]